MSRARRWLNGNLILMSKKLTPPREMGYKKPFLKDWLSLSRSGQHDMTRLKQVMLLLIAFDAPLGAQWRDHALKGPWADCRVSCGRRFPADLPSG
nr:type II toxin-antitoxin system mRNA interferase toxin, RelE/StbE family [Duganella radicis]